MVSGGTRSSLVALAVALVSAACGSSALVSSGPTPTPGPGPFIPAAAVLYGDIARDRPGSCYPIEEAAKFSLLDLSQYLAGRTSRWCGAPDRPVQAIRALNPASTILIYQFSPGSIRWVGGRSVVGGQQVYQELRASHGIGLADPWFAPGYRTNDYLVDMNYPQYMAMDLGNVNWRRYWTEQTWQEMWGSSPVVDARGASGLFVDGAQLGAYSHFPYCPLSQWDGSRCATSQDYPRPYWTGSGWNDSLWADHMLQFVGEAVPWYRARGLQMMFNVWTLSQRYVDHLNQVGALGAMEECGFVCGSFPPTPTHWQARLDMLRGAVRFAVLSTNRIRGLPGTGLDKMDAVVWNGLRGWDVLWFAMGSFLLGYDPQLRNGYFHFTAGWSGGDYRDTYWFDEYDPRYLHLGAPRGAARQLSSGVWEREFERGWVWVNPSGSDQAVSVPSGRARILNHDDFKSPQSVVPVERFNLRAWTAVLALRE
jgi:hypothetical protein